MRARGELLCVARSDVRVLVERWARGDATRDDLAPGSTAATAPAVSHRDLSSPREAASLSGELQLRRRVVVVRRVDRDYALEPAVDA